MIESHRVESALPAMPPPEPMARRAGKSGDGVVLRLVHRPALEQRLDVLRTELSVHDRPSQLLAGAYGELAHDAEGCLEGVPREGAHDHPPEAWVQIEQPPVAIDSGVVSPRWGALEMMLGLDGRAVGTSGPTDPAMQACFTVPEVRNRVAVEEEEWQRVGSVRHFGSGIVHVDAHAGIVAVEWPRSLALVG
jgi:hypothetical protein